VNEFEGIIGMQVSAMLEGISQDLERRRTDLLDNATRDATKLVRRGRTANLRQLRSDIAEERRLHERAVQKERASQATASRQVLQGRDRERLLQGKELLRAVLMKRWRRERSRWQWIEMLIGEAADVIESGRWIVQHPSDLTEADLKELSLAVMDVAGSPPELVMTEEMTAGLRIARSGAVLDASLEGLMAYEDVIESLLLAEILALTVGRETGEDSVD
jgi:hypothetical protein